MSTLSDRIKEEQLKEKLTKDFGPGRRRQKSIIWIDKKNGEKHIISLGPVYNVRDL